MVTWYAHEGVDIPHCREEGFGSLGQRASLHGGSEAGTPALTGLLRGCAPFQHQDWSQGLRKGSYRDGQRLVDAIGSAPTGVWPCDPGSDLRSGPGSDTAMSQTTAVDQQVGCLFVVRLTGRWGWAHQLAGIPWFGETGTILVRQHQRHSWTDYGVDCRSWGRFPSHSRLGPPALHQPPPGQNLVWI